MPVEFRHCFTNMHNHPRITTQFGDRVAPARCADSGTSCACHSLAKTCHTQIPHRVRSAARYSISPACQLPISADPRCPYPQQADWLYVPDLSATLGKECSHFERLLHVITCI